MPTGSTLRSDWSIRSLCTTSLRCLTAPWTILNPAPGVTLRICRIISSSSLSDRLENSFPSTLIPNSRGLLRNVLSEIPRVLEISLQVKPASSLRLWRTAHELHEPLACQVPLLDLVYLRNYLQWLANAHHCLSPNKGKTYFRNDFSSLMYDLIRYVSRG